MDMVKYEKSEREKRSTKPKNPTKVNKILNKNYSYISKKFRFPTLILKCSKNIYFRREIAGVMFVC